MSENASQNATFSLTRQLRPIRLAFLVRPSDSRSLRRVFQINTCLWGGRYNAIIPYYERRPPNWASDPPVFSPSAKQIIRGYIECFEPDFIVEMPHTRLPVSTAPKDKVLKATDVLTPGEDSPVQYGLSVVELWGHLYDREFKFERRHPIDVRFYRAAEKAGLLLVAATFGDFPKSRSLRYLSRLYREYFGATLQHASLSDVPRILTQDGGSPLGIGSSGLKTPRLRGHSRASVFALDPTNGLDLVDYWNLRALGLRVFPAPMGELRAISEPLSQLIREHWQRLSGRPDPWRHTTLMKARSLERQSLDDLRRELDVPGGSAVLQTWYPRLWEEFGRNHDIGTERTPLAEEDTMEVVSSRAHCVIPPLRPAFLQRAPLSSKPLWVNELSLRTLGKNTSFATVFDQSLGNVDSLVQSFTFNSVYASPRGTLLAYSSSSSPHYWQVPSNIEVFEAWAQVNGFNLSLSGAGRIAQQLVESVDGPLGAWAISQREVVDLLATMAQGKTLGRSELKGHLLHAHNNHIGEADRHLKVLLSNRILALGLRLQCPFCGQRPWYELESLATSLECSHCLRQFGFPSASPPRDAWHYRAIGAFSVKDYAQGAYTVALTLRFLAMLGHGDLSYIPSFNLKASHGVDLEADLGVFLQPDTLRRQAPLLIFGECKSFNKFKQRDFSRMRQLARRFPGASLLLCTLRKTLSRAEKDNIGRLATAGRRTLQAERWRNPVVVLTGTELFTTMGIPSCWKRHGARAAKLADQYDHLRENNLQNLADITQQLHLGLQSYSSWLKADIARRIARRQQARSAS